MFSKLTSLIFEWITSQKMLKRGTRGNKIIVMSNAYECGQVVEDGIKGTKNFSYCVYSRTEQQTFYTGSLPFRAHVNICELFPE